MTASVGTGRNHGGPSYSTRPPTPLDVERYLVAPQGLDLEQVHVFVRHGESAATLKTCRYGGSSGGAWT